MLNSRLYSYESRGGIAQRIFGALAFLLIISLCFYLFFQIYKLLFYLSPVFVIIAFIIYPKIVMTHIKMIGQSFHQNILGGLLEFGLQIIGLPLVSIGLVIKAWAYKKFGQFQEKAQMDNIFEERYTQFEEVHESPSELLESKKSENSKKESNNYEDLYE